jgi:hypothetical protein
MGSFLIQVAPGIVVIGVMPSMRRPVRVKSVFHSVLNTSENVPERHDPWTRYRVYVKDLPFEQAALLTIKNT